MAVCWLMVHAQNHRVPYARATYLRFCRGEEVFKVYVEGLSHTRGPAAVAQKLYRETQESKTMREARAAAAKIAFEPSVARKGRPTKKEGRELRRFKDSL